MEVIPLHTHKYEHVQVTGRVKKESMGECSLCKTYPNLAHNLLSYFGHMLTFRCHLSSFVKVHPHFKSFHITNIENSCPSRVSVRFSLQNSLLGYQPYPPSPSPPHTHTYQEDGCGMPVTHLKTMFQVPSVFPHSLGGCCLELNVDPSDTQKGLVELYPRSKIIE